MTSARAETHARKLLAVALAVFAPIGCNLLVGFEDHHLRPAESAGDHDAGADGETEAGDGGLPDAGKWVVLASAQAWPIAVKVNDGYVYWINGAHDGVAGSIKRMQTHGGPVETVAEGLGNPTSFAFTKSANIYFTSDRGGVSGDPGIFRVTEEGLSANPNEVPVEFTDGLGANAIGLANGHVYTEAWEPNAPARLRLSPFFGDDFATCYPYATEENGRILDLVVTSATDLFLIDEKKNAIMHTGADCDAGSSVFAANEPAVAIGNTSTRLYWITKTAARSRELDGGPDAAVTELIDTLSNASGFTIVNGGIVITDAEAGTIVFANATGHDKTIAWGQNDPSAIGHDLGGSVYWSNRAGGEIVRLDPPF